jgi:hypothetical protein
MYPENISGARRWSNVCIHVSYVHAFSLSDTVCEACVRVGRHRGRGPCGWRPAGRSVPSHTRDGGPATVRQLAGTNAHGGIHECTTTCLSATTSISINRPRRRPSMAMAMDARTEYFCRSTCRSHYSTTACAWVHSTCSITDQLTHEPLWRGTSPR